MRKKYSYRISYNNYVPQFELQNGKISMKTSEGLCIASYIGIKIKSFWQKQIWNMAGCDSCKDGHPCYSLNL